MISVSTMERNKSHGLATSETDSEIKILAKNRLPGVEEIMETEMKDIV